jgi:hypothetical protein
MAENKETPKTSTEKVQEKPEDMAFKNEAIKRISELQYENKKLKEYMGRRQQAPRRSSGSASAGITGLRGLGTRVNLPRKK